MGSRKQRLGGKANRIALGMGREALPPAGPGWQGESNVLGARGPADASGRRYYSTTIPISLARYLDLHDGDVARWHLDDGGGLHLSFERGPARDRG